MQAPVLVMPRKKSKRNDVPAKIDAEVMRIARIVAAYEEVEIAELVSETLRPILTQRLADHQSKASDSPPPKPARKPRSD